MGWARKHLPRLLTSSPGLVGRLSVRDMGNPFPNSCVSEEPVSGSPISQSKELSSPRIMRLQSATAQPSESLPERVDVEPGVLVYLSSQLRQWKYSYPPQKPSSLAQIREYHSANQSLIQSLLSCRPTDVEPDQTRLEIHWGHRLCHSQPSQDERSLRLNNNLML